MVTVVSIQRLADGSLGLHTLAVGAGYLGAVLGVCMVVPQILRTFADRSRPGVSVTSWTLTALSCLTWMLYGVRADEVPQIPGNVLMVTGAALIVLAVPSTTSVPARAIRVGAAALLIVGLAVVLPAAAIGLLAFGIGLFSTLPQTVTSLTRPPLATSAVSVSAWLLRGAAQVCWLMYAINRHDVTLMISASFILLTSVVIAIGERTRRPGARPAAAPAADAVQVNA